MIPFISLGAFAASAAIGSFMRVDIIIAIAGSAKAETDFIISECQVVPRESDPIAYTMAFFSARLGRAVRQEEAQRIIESASLVFRLLDEEARRMDGASPAPCQTKREA